jgi:hypothetical protein
MLADLSLLLHEVTDVLRRRRPAPTAAGRSDPALGGPPPVVLVTGTASPGRTRLLTALERGLSAHGIRIETSERAIDRRVPVLRVHAESDIDALLETGPGTEGAWARQADLLVPVDWEATAHSVRRIVDALVARGVAIGDAGV